MGATARLREAICRFGHLLYMRGLAHGSTGNISVRTDAGLLVTPTSSCLGLLEPEALSLVAEDGAHLAGRVPSKETLLHLAVYRQRPTAKAIVHLHCTHAVAVSCLACADPDDVLPPLTAYQMMRVGRLALIPYAPPGDLALVAAVEAKAARHHALLLAHHGPVVAGRSLEDAVFASEELEETAKLSLLLHGRGARTLSAEQLAALAAIFPS